ncbi:MAG: DUF554 domain-containing protein, partial [Deltaproteobacteria bacterium]
VLLVGVITGEILKIEEAITHIGEKLKTIIAPNATNFVNGFVTASLLFATGAMAIVGAIQNGTSGNAEILYMKSILDCVASIALASTLGIGVLFASVSVFVFQGAISLVASNVAFIGKPAVIAAITATGGVTIMAIGINLLEIVKIRIGSLLPSIVYAIIWANYFA